MNTLIMNVEENKSMDIDETDKSMDIDEIEQIEANNKSFVGSGMIMLIESDDDDDDDDDDNDKQNNTNKKKSEIIMKIESDNENDNENYLPIRNMFYIHYNIGSFKNIRGDEFVFKKKYKKQINNGIYDIKENLPRIIINKKWDPQRILNVIIGNNYKAEQVCICAPTTDIKNDDNKNDELITSTDLRLNWLYNEKEDFGIKKLQWYLDQKLNKNIPRVKLCCPKRYYGPCQSNYIMDKINWFAQYIPNLDGMHAVDDDDESM